MSRPANLWSFAVLLPHPPIVVEAVGRGREREASATVEGFKQVLARLRAHSGRNRPKGLFIISPHQSYAPGALFYNQALLYSGSLAPFGAPEPFFKLQGSEQAQELADYLESRGLPLFKARQPDLTPDHGSLVPLSFLARLWDPLPPLIVASPIGLKPAQALALGRYLAQWPGAEGWALVASGDLSHRLKEDGPYGFHPQGPLFDRELTEALKLGQASELLERWPPRRLEEAGECGFRSALALIGLAGAPVELLSYEGPFGVGYCTALWLNESAAI